MTNVRRIFFITEVEAKQLRIEFDDPYIAHDMPHYELEDGTVQYGKLGAPAAYERWYDTPVTNRKVKP